MSTVLGLVRATLTKENGIIQNLTQASDFTSVSAETRDFAPAGDTNYAFIDLIIPRIKDRIGADTLILEIYGRNRHEEPLELLGTFPLGADDQPVPCKMKSKVFFRARFVDQQLRKRWNLYGLQVFGEPDGSYFP